MNDKITVFHRVILWICLITSFIFGFGYYVAPEFSTSLLDVNAPELTSIMCIGGFLIASVVAAAFSLKSGLWSEVRIPTYFLLTWSLLNGLRLGWFVVTESDFSLLPNVVNCLIIGLGLAYSVIRRKSSSKK